MEFISSTKSGYEGLLSTFSKLGALNIDYLEKLAEKQMETAQFCSDIGIAQLKTVQSLDSIDSIKDYSATTMEASTKLAKKMLEDSKEVMAMGSSYKDGVVEIVRDLSVVKAEEA